MCCFSVASPVGLLARLFAAFAPPVHVSATHIFARMIEPGVQALAYGNFFKGDQVAWRHANKTYAEIVDTEQPMLRRELQRKLPNQDTWIRA